MEEGIKDSEEQSRGRKVKNDQQKGREEKKGEKKRSGIGFGPPVSPSGAHFPPLCAWGLFLALEG